MDSVSGGNAAVIVKEEPRSLLLLQSTLVFSFIGGLLACLVLSVIHLNGVYYDDPHAQGWKPFLATPRTGFALFTVFYAVVFVAIMLCEKIIDSYIQPLSRIVIFSMLIFPGFTAITYMAYATLHNPSEWASTRYGVVVSKSEFYDMKDSLTESDAPQVKTIDLDGTERKITLADEGDEGYLLVDYSTGTELPVLYQQD